MSAARAISEAAGLLSRPGLGRVLDLLDAAGEEARIAGGAVRDLLIGRPVREVDIATTALPDEVMRRAGEAGIKAVPTGIAHGTVTLVLDGEAYEATTLRRDVATDGRHAEVAFGRDWAADARRRDFTINGLFLDRAGEVHDHVGGLADIAAQRLAFIGDPQARIREDYLRILRFFRFHATLPFGAPDRAALEAAGRCRDGLSRLSRERIGQEMTKLLAGDRAGEALRLMAGRGLLVPVTGGVASVTALDRLAALEAELGRPADIVLRLAALSVFKKEDAERLGAALRLPGRSVARLAWTAGPPITIDLAPGDRRAWLYRIGTEAFRDRVMIGWSRDGASAAEGDWRALLELPETWAVPVFPISGRDLAARGVPPGPRMGRVLAAAEARWIAEDFPDAMPWLDDLIAETR